jgi:hypothetical protein
MPAMTPAIPFAWPSIPAGTQAIPFLTRSIPFGLPAIHFVPAAIPLVQKPFDLKGKQFPLCRR